jgi:hypothetical protein
MKKIILKFYFSKFPKGQNSLAPLHKSYTFYYLGLLHLSFIRLEISPFNFHSFFSTSWASFWDCQIFIIFSSSSDEFSTFSGII